ncbi:FmdB family zinc ribbon protein [Leifsonia sp. 21MFCrub1.1]|uniref:FmdB family zinc ribbon protein n=1 Tax=Leifsonia sp. 21MFCrub1.1 TaxID=1798223 RepID=UPI0008929074|nr:FmdB family zinc ribbon protein [Leifsonia sp. 21MFCrub1.1]SEA63638.1 putative regulatory protein, FmdB family [Leifsonia sp. 21MFCrub1.1]
MPTYSYSCRDCGHAFDIQQAFTDDALTVCPNCGGSLRKVFGTVGVTFNGSGFYRTDSRGGAKKTDAAPASGSSSSGSGSSGSSSSGSSGSSSSGSSGSSSSSSTSSTPSTPSSGSAA